MKPEKDKKRPYRPNQPSDQVLKREEEWSKHDRHNGYSVADVAAMQALFRGEADTRQQQRAVDWILNVAAKVYDEHYFDHPRDTDFALGKRFVGQEILKLSKLDTGELEKRLKLKQP